MTSVRSAMMTSDSDVDRYIKESVKSFHDCSVKNNARRNSLQRRTLGIESERRLASARLSREERQLRAQLRQMSIEKAKNHIVHNLRETKSHKKHEKVGGSNHTDLRIPVEPYPVTFRTDSPSSEVEGAAYARHGRRRKSHEFEDLHLNTGATGTLFHIPEHAHRNDEDDGQEMRRRVYSMSAAHRILAKKRVQGSSSSSNASTPRHSPNTKRKHQLHKKGGNSNSSPRESIHGSTEKITSLSDLHWVGDPEAIHSIRRARLTVDEQELETELHKLSVS